MHIGVLFTYENAQYALPKKLDLVNLLLGYQLIGFGALCFSTRLSLVLIVNKAQKPSSIRYSAFVIKIIEYSFFYRNISFILSKKLRSDLPGSGVKLGMERNRSSNLRSSSLSFFGVQTLT